MLIILNNQRSEIYKEPIQFQQIQWFKYVSVQKGKLKVCEIVNDINFFFFVSIVSHISSEQRRENSKQIEWFPKLEDRKKEKEKKMEALASPVAAFGQNQISSLGLNFMFFYNLLFNPNQWFLLIAFIFFSELIVNSDSTGVWVSGNL